MNETISRREYDASGEGVSRAPTGAGYTHFPVWREAITGHWYAAHPTDPRGDHVRYEGEVRDVHPAARCGDLMPNNYRRLCDSCERGFGPRESMAGGHPIGCGTVLAEVS